MTIVQDAQQPQRAFYNSLEIHTAVLKDHKLKTRENENISLDRVQKIFIEKSGMKRLSTRWQLRLLTVCQKRSWMKISQHCLQRFKRNSTKLLRRFITIDETWIHCCRSGCVPKKEKTIPPAGKALTTVFFDCGCQFWITTWFPFTR